MKENPFNGTVSRICFIKKNSVFICVLYLKSKCFETRLRCELQDGQFYRIDVRHFNDVNMAKELSNWEIHSSCLFLTNLNTQLVRGIEQCSNFWAKYDN